MSRDDVDPQIREFLTRTSAATARLAGEGTIDLARRRSIAEQVRKPWVEGGPQMADTREVRIGIDGLRLRIHRPTGSESLPVLLYIHGGGWTIFSLDTHDRLMREYAHRSGLAVVGVDYTLSPEVRFPHALHEVAEAIGWLRTEGHGFGLDPTRIIAGGDSAGANLALAAALLMRERGDEPLAGLMLAYGAFDDRHRASHDRFGGEAYMLTPAEMEDFWDSYRGSERGDDPLARPLLAELHDLPPSFFCIAECDILADENRELAERMDKAGVEVTMRIYQGATHSFLEAVNISALADRALAEASEWLKKQCAR